MQTAKPAESDEFGSEGDEPRYSAANGKHKIKAPTIRKGGIILIL